MNLIAILLVILIGFATTLIFPTLGSFILSLVMMGLLGLLILASCFIHRFWFAQLQAKDGFRLVTFNDRSAFVSWSTPPRWWEYRVVYLGTAAAGSGDVADCRMGQKPQQIACRLKRRA